MTSVLRWAAMRAILMFHNCEGQRHKTVSTDHNFWRERRAEADLNQGPSAYHPNALPLGQIGSLSSLHTLSPLIAKCRAGWWGGGVNGSRPCTSRPSTLEAYIFRRKKNYNWGWRLSVAWLTVIETLSEWQHHCGTWRRPFFSSYLWSGIWWHRRWAWPWLGRGPQARPVQHIWRWRHRHPGPLVCRSHRKFHPHCPGRKDGWRCRLGAVGRQKANVWAKPVSVLWMGLLWVVQREGEKLHCCLMFPSDQELLPISAANSAFWPAVCRKVHNLWSTIHNNYKLAAMLGVDILWMHLHFPWTCRPTV